MVHDVPLLERVVHPDGTLDMPVEELREELAAVGLQSKWEACERLAELDTGKADQDRYNVSRNNWFLRVVRDQLEVEPLLAVAEYKP